MIKLMSAMPNSLLAVGSEYTLTITGVSEENVSSILCGRSQSEWESFVGHDSTAQLFSERLAQPIKCQRINVTLEVNDLLIVGLFTPPHRLGEGEKWTEEEILSMPINWVMIQKHLTETISIIQSDYRLQPVV